MEFSWLVPYINRLGNESPSYQSSLLNEQMTALSYATVVLSNFWLIMRLLIIWLPFFLFVVTGGAAVKMAFLVGVVQEEWD